MVILAEQSVSSAPGISKVPCRHEMLRTERIEQVMQHRWIIVLTTTAIAALTVSCGSSPPRSTAQPVEPEDLGPTPLQIYYSRLEARRAAGDTAPVDVTDPGHILVYCVGLFADQSSADGYLSFGIVRNPSITCQNTVDGKKLVELRRWSCGDRTDRNCICGRPGSRDFVYLFDEKGYEAVRFDAGENAVSSREYVDGDSIYGSGPTGRVSFGGAYDLFRLDARSLDVKSTHPVSPGVTLMPCKLEDRGQNAPQLVPDL